MNTTPNDCNMFRSIEIESRLNEISSERQPLEEAVASLSDELERYMNEVRSRDWVLDGRVTGRRPRGAHSDGSVEETYAQRANYVQNARVARHDLDTVRGELRQIDNEASALLNELAAVRRALVTPESLAADIAHAGEVLAVLEGERAKLSDSLDRGLKQQTLLGADLDNESVAAVLLEQARADAYLSPDDGELAAAVDHAEAAAAMAREKAAGARAAADRVVLQVAGAREALAAHDARLVQQSAKVEALTQRRATLLARLTIHAAAAGMGAALVELLAVDEREGVRLAMAWAREGLRVPDMDGVPRLAPWLQGTLTARTCVEHRAALLAALTPT